MKKRHFVGTTNKEERPYERVHKQIAREAAEQGFVLLKNAEQILPLAPPLPLALYGAGASKTIKGGTGSGDVNERKTVSIEQGLKDAGYRITSDAWLRSFDETYEKERYKWRDAVWAKVDADPRGAEGLFDAYSQTPFEIPSGSLPTKTDADIAIYVISRIEGEGADRTPTKGDYYLSDKEEAILTTICTLYEKVIVLLNIGSPIDLSFMDRFSNIDALLLISQPGMEGGTAVARLLSGCVSPSGKLTDTLAFHYEDYPSSATFSSNDGDLDKTVYTDGIYVGYRYFDTFHKPVRYCFGYGLSYASFALSDERCEKVGSGQVDCALQCHVRVTNTSTQYAGSEVVEVYASLPQTRLDKEYRRLVGFAKTRVLAKGATEEVSMVVPLKNLASYDVSLSSWIIEKGSIIFFVGTSLENAHPFGVVKNEEDLIIEIDKPVCPVQEPIEEIVAPRDEVLERRGAILSQLSAPSIVLQKSDVLSLSPYEEKKTTPLDQGANVLVEQLTTEQLIHLATGEMGQGETSNLGSAGIRVPGSAAQTSNIAMEQGIPSLVLADGPAGLRLTQEYEVQDGVIVPQSFASSLEHGFLSRGENKKGQNRWYQYCTAFPVGTLLSQTWDTAVLERVGRAVEEEMEEFDITLWLAPGMNIQRNPLCGRNFEYYSEDPLLTGKCAAALTKGVQEKGVCGTTIKHFALNNQENNRMGMDSQVNERALREIYLRGFEIAIKEAHPFALMTSYNKVNGIHAANNADLCTAIVRDEWHFTGVIMTDWTTTHYGPDCTASGCMKAGNDCVMPGISADHDNIREALQKGEISLDTLKKCVAHLLSVIMKSKSFKEM